MDNMDNMDNMNNTNSLECVENSVTRRQKNLTVFLLDRHVLALEKLSKIQEVSKSKIIRDLIDRAVGYKRKLI